MNGTDSMNAAATSALTSDAGFSARELDRKASSSLIWQAAKVAVHMAQYIALARLVVPAEFGKFALAAPLFAVLSAINDGGLSIATITGKHYDARLASTLWWTQAGLGLVAAAIMVMASPLLAAWFDIPDLISIGLWLAASLTIASWGLQSRALLRREMRLGPLALVDIGGICAGLSAAWIASRWMHGVALLVIAQIAGAAAGSALAVAFAPLRLQRPVLSENYRQAVRVGWHVVGSDLLSIIRSQCPTFIIGFFLAVSQVGLFSRAIQLLSFPITVLSPAMANFLLPLLARSRERPVEFRQHVRRTQRLFLAAAMPVSVWIAMGPKDLIVFALGGEWLPVTPILQALSLLFVSQVMASVARTALLAKEEARAERFFSFVNLALTAIVVLATAPFGVVAVALALAISGIALRAPILAVLAVRRHCLAAADVLDGLRVIAVLAAISGLASWAFRALSVPGIARDILGLIAVAAISAVAIGRIARRPYQGQPG